MPYRSAWSRYPDLQAELAAIRSRDSSPGYLGGMTLADIQASLGKPTQHPIGIGGIVGLITLLVLWVVKPKAVMKYDHESGKDKMCWRTALLWSILIGLVVGLLYALSKGTLKLSA